jgi:hypothetical protein
MHALLLFLALLNPHFTAQWDSAHSATLQWSQQGRGCVAVEHLNGERAFIGCYEKTGTITITLGHAGPLSGDLRPAPGDVYVLSTGGQVVRAPIRGRQVYLAVWRG